MFVASRCHFLSFADEQMAQEAADLRLEHRSLLGHRHLLRLRWGIELDAQLSQPLLEGQRLIPGNVRIDSNDVQIR